MFNFFNEDISLPNVDLKKVERWLKNVIQEKGYEVGEISYIFCSDPYILKINLEYLNHNYFTDIITEVIDAME